MEGSDGNAYEISGIVRVVREVIVRDRKSAAKTAVKPVVAVVLEVAVGYGKGATAAAVKPVNAVIAEDAIVDDRGTGHAADAVPCTVFAHAVLE